MSRRQGFTLAARASLPSSGAVSKEQEGGLSIALVLQVAGEAAWGFPGGCQSQEKRKTRIFVQSHFLLADISVALMS